MPKETPEEKKITLYIFGLVKHQIMGLTLYVFVFGKNIICLKTNQKAVIIMFTVYNKIYFRKTPL